MALKIGVNTVGVVVLFCDIAELLCSPSELKRKKYGERRPNSREEWLDVQARALAQAAACIRSCFKYN